MMLFFHWERGIFDTVLYDRGYDKFEKVNLKVKEAQ